MNSQHPRSLAWLLPFALPTCVVILFWTSAMIPAFRSTSHGLTGSGDSTLTAFLLFSLLELGITSIAFSWRQSTAFRVVGIGLLFFVLAVVGNVVATVAVTFAGCACAASLSR